LVDAGNTAFGRYGPFLRLRLLLLRYP